MNKTSSYLHQLLNYRMALRFVIPVVIVLLSLHYLYILLRGGYGSTLTAHKSIWQQQVEREPSNRDLLEMLSHRLEIGTVRPAYRANATLLMLARNYELPGVMSSMRQLEDRFNRKYNYPWVFLNDEPFTDEFKQRVGLLASGDISFGVIPHDRWYQPDWIDEDKARQAREKLEAEGVLYAGSVSYRNMCRFNSGFFFQHELLKPYRYYWRVEPNVHYFCDIDYDPFVFMQDEKKVYGFTMSLYEWYPTIPSLWPTVKEFLSLHPEYLAPHNSLQFISDNNGDDYNGCHFWSNFEIGDMDFWRSPVYTEYFNFLDNKGGFYYERWGDAPVHSIAASLFLNTSQVHYFNDIGYKHTELQHCPQGELHAAGKCYCDINDDHNLDLTQWRSCVPRWLEMSSKNDQKLRSTK